MPDDFSFTPTLQTKVAHLLEGAALLDIERRKVLLPLAELIGGSQAAGVRLHFICTHNSRRSQLAQVWAMTSAAYFGIEGIECFSGGTEVTAFNCRAVAALERAGFLVESDGTEDNPRYRVRPGERSPELTCFSKRFDDATNPSKDFLAVMTCASADRSCPVIPGATRVSLTYEDPKVSDGTPRETSCYDERSDQIGRELLWVCGRVAGRFE